MSKKKTLLGILSITTLLLVAGLVILVFDYSKYRNSQNSTFFGSKDAYAQNQSLYFDDLKVTVSEVEHKRYDYQTSDSCMKIGQEAGDIYSANGFVETPEWELKVSQSNRCLDMAQLYENNKMLVVHYFVENTSSQPLGISPYTIKVYGDKTTESAKSENKITTLLANQSRYDSFVIHHLGLDKNGPFALIVSKDGKQKQIQLDLPEIEPFCDSEACKQEVYRR